MIVWPVEKIETETRRLKIIQYLAALGNYEANANLLLLRCRQIGIPTTADQLVMTIAWLEEAELVTVRSFDKEPIARLTPNGREVADGTRSHPGVMRPDP